MMKVEILTTLPPSGEYEEYNFGSGNDLLWVKFIDDDYSEWVAKFGLGDGYTNKIIQYGADTVYILAHGLLYKFNFKEKRILKVFYENSFSDLIISSQHHKIIVNDGLAIYIYDPQDQLLFQTERISLDGIEFISLEDEYIVGKLNDMTDDWSEFKFNLKSYNIASRWLFYNSLRKL